MYHDHYPGCGIPIAVFHGVKNNLSINKITRTQSDPNTHFDLSHALPIYPQAKKTKSGIVKGRGIRGVWKASIKTGEEIPDFHRDFAP